MPFIASKLPHGLKIDHGGQSVILNGANVGEKLDDVGKNGEPRENSHRAYGFGITELTPAQAETFEAWKKSVTYHDGQKVRGGFKGFENGALLGPFKTRDEANKECASASGFVTTGFEGVDPVKEAKKKGGVQTRED